MSLRKATIEDVTDMDRINRLVLPENYPLNLWTAVISAQKGSNFVIERDNEIVAYIIGVVDLDKQDRIKGHVYSIGVLPDNTRKGYGKMLLDAFEHDLKDRFGVTNVTLHVRKTNKDAIAFYQRCGYQCEKKVKEYYGRGNDGYLFKKRV